VRQYKITYIVIKLHFV